MPDFIDVKQECKKTYCDRSKYEPNYRKGKKC